jgi:hypothetical protein
MKKLAAVAMSVLTGVLVLVSGRDFLSMRPADAIFPSRGLTAVRHLSDYCPSLRNSPGDTPVFLFDSGRGGGRVLVCGGTHPNEPSGTMTAVVLAENIRVDAGAVILVPWANASGFTHSDPQEASPQRYEVPTAAGRRTFRFGSRATNPVHQWPDPVIYINPRGQRLAGVEARNLNRTYPGKSDGTLTERVAFAVMELIRKERVDLGLDLHESAPEYPVINAFVFHDKAADLAASAQMELQAQGWEFRLEASPANLRGLSHREWGDAAGILAVLIETPNASQGRLKGRPSVSLIVDGRDKFYEAAGRMGRLFVPFGAEGVPLGGRVARHLAAIESLLAALHELDPEKSVAVVNAPVPAEVKARGPGAFLR